MLIRVRKPLGIFVTADGAVLAILDRSVSTFVTCQADYSHDTLPPAEVSGGDAPTGLFSPAALGHLLEALRDRLVALLTDDSLILDTAVVAVPADWSDSQVAAVREGVTDASIRIVD